MMSRRGGIPFARPLFLTPRGSEGAVPDGRRPVPGMPRRRSQRGGVGIASLPAVLRRGGAPTLPDHVEGPSSAGTLTREACSGPGRAPAARRIMCRTAPPPRGPEELSNHEHSLACAPRAPALRLRGKQRRGRAGPLRRPPPEAPAAVPRGAREAARRGQGGTIADGGPPPPPGDGGNPDGIDAPPPPPPADAGRVSLGDGWHLQASAKVMVAGAALSTPGFDDGAWVAARVPTTVLAALVGAGSTRTFQERQPPAHPGHRLRGLVVVSPRVRSARRRRVRPRAPRLRRDQLPGERVANGQMVAGEADVRGTYRTYLFDVTALIKRSGKNALAVEVFRPESGDLAINWWDWGFSRPTRTWASSRTCTCARRERCRSMTCASPPGRPDLRTPTSPSPPWSPTPATSPAGHGHRRARRSPRQPGRHARRARVEASGLRRHHHQDPGHRQPSPVVACGDGRRGVAAPDRQGDRRGRASDHQRAARVGLPRDHSARPPGRVCSRSTGSGSTCAGAAGPPTSCCAGIPRASPPRWPTRSTSAST